MQLLIRVIKMEIFGNYLTLIFSDNINLTILQKLFILNWLEIQN